MKRSTYTSLLLLWCLLAVACLGIGDLANGAVPKTQASGDSGADKGPVVGGSEGESGPQSGSLPSTAAAPPAGRGLTTAGEDFKVILAAKTVAVVGMDLTGKKCSRPPFPCAKKAREQTETALQKWWHFTLVSDPAGADLVFVAMETSHPELRETPTYAQLRVFRGPVATAFLAEVQKKLADQWRAYTGPVPLAMEHGPVWEGWRSNLYPGVKNPVASKSPSAGQLLLMGVFDRLDRRRRDLPRQSDGGIDDITGKTARELHRRVAEDFCQALVEAERSVSVSAVTGTAPTAQPQPTASAVSAPVGRAMQESPRPPSATQPPVVPAQADRQTMPSLPPVAERVQVRIPGGTPVHVVLNSPISSETSKKDELLEFVVAEPVIVDGATVIAAGAVGHGKVVEAKKSAEGKDGVLAWAPTEVSTEGGTPVPLRLLKMPPPGRRANASDVVWTVMAYAFFPVLLTGDEGWDLLLGTGEQHQRGRAAEVQTGEHFLVFVKGDAVATGARTNSSGPVAESPPFVSRESKPIRSSKPLSFVPLEADYFIGSEKQFLLELQTKLDKAAAGGFRLVAATDKGLLLEKAAISPDLYRYRVLPISESDYEKLGAALNQGGVWGYRWWRNALGEARWDEFVCVLEKPPGRPNQFQYEYPSKPGTLGTTVSAKQVRKVNQWFAEAYQEGYREGYHIPYRGAVLERFAEPPAGAHRFEELDRNEPYLWLPGLSSLSIIREIRAAASSGHRVMRCSYMAAFYDCLLTKAAKPGEGAYDYQLFSVEPGALETLEGTLNRVGAQGYRVQDVVTTAGGSSRSNLELLLEKAPQDGAHYQYGVIRDKTAEGLVSALNDAAEQGYVLRKYYYSEQLRGNSSPGWVAVVERPAEQR
jgi:hypothetical protein